MQLNYLSFRFRLSLREKQKPHQGLLLSLIIQLTGATLFGFIIAATRRIVQFIAPIQKVTITNLQVTARSLLLIVLAMSKMKSPK